MVNICPTETNVFVSDYDSMFLYQSKNFGYL